MISCLVNSLLMLEHMGVQLKTCLTVAAVKGAWLKMDLFVSSQDIEDWEGFSADVALKTPLTLHFLFSIFNIPLFLPVHRRIHWI